MSTRKREEIPFVFSQRIKQLIGDDSVSSFSRRVGLKQASVDRYVKAVHTPSAEAITAIATQCGVTADWLLGLSDNPSNTSSPDWEDRARVAEHKLVKVNNALALVIKGAAELQEAVK